MIDINKNVNDNIEETQEETQGKISAENNEQTTEETNEDTHEKIHDETQDVNDFEVLNKNPLNIDSTNSILEGGVSDIVYNIDFILPEDEKLINIEKVIKQVDKYIENYNSSQMKKYIQTFTQLYQKYSNKKYTIKTVKNKNDSIKIIVIKNDGKDDKDDKDNTNEDKDKDKDKDKNKDKDKDINIIKEITKPIYLFYDEDCNLYKLKNKISNARIELQYKYELLTSKLNITIDDKKVFELEREKFIELLEEYYIYTLYHKKINNISTVNKTNLLIQELVGFYNNNNDDVNIPILNSNLFYIDNSSIEILNKNYVDKLNQFNNLVIQLAGKDSDKLKKDKKLMEDIKIYLDKKEISITNVNIKKTTIQQSEENIINYIILSLPIV
jgi:hypothetical protein